MLCSVRLVAPVEAAEEDLRLHHSADYLRLLKIPDSETEEHEEHGLGWYL